MKIAFAFAGQGAQYVGMGRELYDDFSEVREVFQLANKTLDINISKICFEGPEVELNDTENTQPVLLTISTAISLLLEKEDIKADMAAGLSLGEYGALVYSGAITFEDGLKIVKKRGRYMKESVPKGNFGMIAVMGLPNETIEQICDKYLAKGHIYPANYNCPGQLVVGGDLEVLNLAKEEFKEAGAKRVIELSVSSPFHTPILGESAKKLEIELDKTHFGGLHIPVISNVSAREYMDSQIKDSLVKHIISPVKFEQSIKYMIENGVDTFIEIGPGKVLSGFIKKIDKGVNVFNVQDSESLHNTIKSIKGLRG